MSDASIVLALAKSNGVYRRAVESDPRFVRACQVRQQVLAVQLKLPAVQRPESPIKSELPLSDWLDARVAVDSAERAREVKLTALRALLRDCESRDHHGGNDRPRPVVAVLRRRTRRAVQRHGTGSAASGRCDISGRGCRRW